MTDTPKKPGRPRGKTPLDHLAETLQTRADELRDGPHTDREDAIAATLEEIVTAIEETTK